MKKLLAIAALATVGLTGAAQAGGYGYSYGYAPSSPSYGYVAPVYHYSRPRYVKRYFVKRHYAPVYGYYGGY